MSRYECVVLYVFFVRMGVCMGTLLCVYVRMGVCMGALFCVYVRMGVWVRGNEGLRYGHETGSFLFIAAVFYRNKTN